MLCLLCLLCFLCCVVFLCQGSDLTWQLLEAVVYCFCAIADQVMEDLAEGVGSKFLEIIPSLLQRITAMPAASTPEPLVAMSCEVIAAYSKLLESAVGRSETGGALLSGVLQLLTQALQSSDDDVFGAASCGLKAVCSACGGRMTDPAVFGQLCAAYEARRNQPCPDTLLITLWRLSWCSQSCWFWCCFQMEMLNSPLKVLDSARHLCYPSSFLAAHPTHRVQPPPTI